MAQPHVERRNGAAVRNAVRARAADVLDDFAELRKDINKLADATQKAAKQEVKHVGRRFGAMGDDLRTRANDGVGYANELVRARPGATVGVSLGVGLLLGLLLAARR